MATHDTFVTVADDDYLSDGYFNGSRTRIFKLANEALVKNALSEKTNGTVTHNKSKRVFVDNFSDTVLVASTTGSPEKRTGSYAFTSSGTIVGEPFIYTEGTIASAVLVSDVDFMETYDEFSDSSVSSVLWTTATTGAGAVSESATQLSVVGSVGGGTGSAKAETNGSGSNNLNGDLVIRFTATAANSGAEAVTILRATDSSTDVTLKSYTNTGITNGHFKVVWNAAAQIADLYINGVLETSKDCSSLSAGTFRLEFDSTTTVSGAHTSSWVVDYIRTNKTSPASTVTYEIAADDTNLESVTPDDEHYFTDTGSTPYLKATITISGSEMVHLDGYGFSVLE